MSSYDVSLTWTRADIEVLTWLLTWSDDVIIPQILVRVGSGFSSWVTDRVAEPLMSSYDVLLTWIRADVEVLAWLLTWSDDVI